MGTGAPAKLRLRGLVALYLDIIWGIMNKKVSRYLKLIDISELLLDR